MLTHKHNSPTFLKELPRLEPLVMDSTASKLMKECLRKYFYRIVLGRVQPENITPPWFPWGTALHKFYEHLETKGLAFAIIEANKFKPSLSEEFKKFGFLDKTRFIKTVNAIVQANQAEKAQGALKVIATEQPFNVELPDGSFIGGRFDQVIEWRGKIWIRDFKTTSKQKNYFQRGMDPNDQAMRYLYAGTMMHLGPEAFEKGKLIDGVIFQAIYNAATVGPELYPILYTKNNAQVKSWVKDQMFLNARLNESRAQDVWPMSECRSCTFCEYAQVCKMPSEAGMVQILKNNYQLKPWDFTNVDQEAIEE